MNYSEILTKAWKTIWNHKILWLFGLLAGCGASAHGGGSGGANSWYSFDQSDRLGRDLDFSGMERFGREVERFFDQPNVWLMVAGVILALICLGLILSLLCTAIGTMGKIGLVRGTLLAETNATPISFGQVWRHSTPSFWRVFLLYLLLWVLDLVVGLLLFIPFFLIILFTLGCGLIPLIPLSILIGAALMVLIELTIVSIVADDQGIFAGIGRAWNLIRSHPGPLAVMALILFLGSAVLSFIFALPFIAAIFPMAIGAINGGSNAILIGLIASGAMILLYLPVLVLLSSVLQAYLGAAWTLVYRSLSRPSAAWHATPEFKPSPEKSSSEPPQAEEPSPQPSQPDAKNEGLPEDF